MVVDAVGDATFARAHAQLRSQQSGHWDSRSSIGWKTQCQTNAIYVHTCADDTLLSPAVSQESTAVSHKGISQGLGLVEETGGCCAC